MKRMNVMNGKNTIICFGKFPLSHWNQKARTTCFQYVTHSHLKYFHLSWIADKNFV